MSRAQDFAVLFDLDGTLVDSIALLVASMEYAYGDRAHRPPVQEWIHAIGTPLDAMLRMWAEDDDDVVHLRARYREYQIANHDAMTQAYPGVVETIRTLHSAGHPLAIVTSKLEVGARRSLAHIGVEACFSAVVGIDATTRHKPDPEPVHFALGRLGVHPSRAIFIGDSTHDMNAGRSAGVMTAAALWGPYSRTMLDATRPTFWLERMDELPPIVERLVAG